MKYRRGISNAQSHKVFRPLSNEMPQFGRRPVLDQQCWEINVDDLEGIEGMTERLQSPRDLPVFYDPVSVRSCKSRGREILTEDIKSERQLYFQRPEDNYQSENLLGEKQLNPEYELVLTPR